MATFCPLTIDIWPKMWFYKGRDLERSKSQVKTNGTIGFLDLKNIDVYVDTKIIILSALVQKLWSKTPFAQWWTTRRVRIHHTFKPFKVFFNLLIGPDPSYLVLKFGYILPINNWDMAQNVILQRSWPWKVKVIGQTNGTIRFLDLKNIYLDAKIVISSVLVRKLWSKTSFCIMVANVTRLHTSHIQIAHDIFWFIERPRSKLPSTC